MDSNSKYSRTQARTSWEVLEESDSVYRNQAAGRRFNVPDRSQLTERERIRQWMEV